MAGADRTSFGDLVQRLLPAKWLNDPPRSSHPSGPTGILAWERLALVSGFALLVACAVGAFVLRQSAIEAQTLVSHSYEVRTAAQDVLGAMRDAETGQRGFLLTEDPGYLEPYVAAIRHLPDMRAALRKLTVDDSEQQNRLSVLDAQVASKLGKMVETIDLAKTGRRDEALMLIKDNTGKQTMDAIRTTITDVMSAESVLLSERQNSLLFLQNAGLVAMLTGFLMSLALAASAVAVLKDQTNALGQANLKLLDANRGLDNRITLQRGELRIGEAQHQFALNASGLGEWALDPQSGQSLRSARHDQIFGYDQPLAHWGFADFIEHVVPDDRAAIMASYAATLASGSDWQFECRIKRTNDNAIRWIEVAGRHYKTASGRAQLVGLVADITVRKQHEELLRASEERFRGTFDNAAVGVAHVGLDGRWLRVNEWLAENVGYSPAELLATTFQDITHPDDLNSDLDMLHQVLAGTLQTYSMDKRYIRKDGSILWAALTVALQRNAAGEPDYFISIVNDITARKQAEEHQRFLMRELSHRSKNLLAVIQSMAGQTARSSATMQDFGDRFGLRLQALAESHDLLTDQSWRGAGLRALVCRQLSSFADPGDKRLTLSGPEVILTTEATQSIGLALHELATNAVKYGALSVPEGKLTVSWSFDDQSQHAHNFHLSWVERGGPAVTPPSRVGFGRTVIERLTAAALDGKVSLEYAPEGVQWCIDAPASCLVSVETAGRLDNRT